MKTLILKTGKEIGCVTDDYIPLKNEILLSEMRLFSMNEPYWDFDKKEFYDKQPQNEVPIIIREQLSRLDFLLALWTQLSLTKEIVKDTIVNLPSDLFDEDSKQKALILFEDAPTFERNNETLLVFAQVFKLTKEQLDNLFIVQ